MSSFRVRLEMLRGIVDRIVRVLCVCVLVATTAMGCGSSTSDASGSGGSGGANGTSVNGCTDADFAANDHSADSDPRVIQGPTGTDPTQYTPHCMRIKAGQTVTFDTDVTGHPIDFSVAPGSPEPFPHLEGKVFSDAGAAVGATVKLDAGGGILAFECSNHPTVMFGAIQSTP